MQIGESTGHSRAGGNLVTTRSRMDPRPCGDDASLRRDVNPASCTVIWRFHDDKSGHINQTRGLVKAIAEITPVETFDLPCFSRRQSCLWWLGNQFPPGENLKRPDLILGAGHATHFALLAARRHNGGKAVVLMKPSLPHWLFDLCIVPDQDGLEKSENVILTRGVLNVVNPSRSQQQERGLILIGGPSSAHGWDNPSIINQIGAIVSNQPDVNWHLTTSRRTPADLVMLLEHLPLPNLTVVPHTSTSLNWVPEQLTHSSQVWVSEDSVSMVSEALTSGASVGLLEVPENYEGRVSQGVQKLRDLGWVTHFTDWDRTRPISTTRVNLNEAQRCATLLCNKFDLVRTV
ncbi:hypothetical protein Pr1d_20070 [Bythopirellula goksoeyrii]|uniref:Nucleoside-diphosphate sugar epimerase n=2 Tax=Bythopirellula goksoeyrii TaxID=1400387 RepID=A0A5B9QAQ0_9BACT|nr:hypothetical protein Pr1d_20070 [Bythopirellula goksoeyrii]